VDYDIEGIKKRDMKKMFRGKYFFSAPYRPGIDGQLRQLNIPCNIDSYSGTISVSNFIEDDLPYTFNLLLGMGMNIVKVNPSGIKKTLKAKDIEKMRILMNNGMDEKLKELFLKSLHDV
jgi:hypothetical protein